MQHLLVDRDEEGTAFTWLNRYRVWSLQHALTWQPYGGGGSSLTMADTERMPLSKAMAWLRWTGQVRQSEADAVRAAAQGGGR